jgi:hypothetical protein
MKRLYEAWNPRADALQIIEAADAICRTYRAQGYDLTLRQLYYQFVARGILPNRQQSYDKLGSIISRARMSGLLDWDYIVDRTRNLRGTSHWSDPSSVIRSAAASFRRDKWLDQPVRVELWVEKEALAGVIERTAAELDLDWFACRGYVSQSEQWAAGQRLLRYIQGGQRVVILHLGDHDPSGIDMTRDITERLHTFIYYDYWRAHSSELGTEGSSFHAIETRMREDLRDDGDPFEVRRIALNMDQVEQYDPPPNPAKLSDSRATGYIAEHGDESWELDALDPDTLDNLIRQHVDELRDDDAYDAAEAVELGDRVTLSNIADRYDEVAELFGEDNER